MRCHVTRPGPKTSAATTPQGGAIDRRRREAGDRRGQDHGHGGGISGDDEDGEEARQSPENAGGELPDHALFDQRSHHEYQKHETREQSRETLLAKTLPPGGGGGEVGEHDFSIRKLPDDARGNREPDGPPSEYISPVKEDDGLADGRGRPSGLITRRS